MAGRESEIAELRAALAPFAAAADRFELRGSRLNSASDAWVLGAVDYLSVGDLRRAAAALQPAARASGVSRLPPGSATPAPISPR